MREWRAREAEEKDSVGKAGRNNKNTTNNGEKKWVVQNECWE